MDFGATNGSNEPSISVSQELSNIQTKVTSPCNDGKVIVTDAEEKDIIEYVLHMAKIGNPRTIIDLPRIVKYVLDKRRKKMFNDGSNLPSANWVQTFLKRHITLNNKVPHGRNPKSTTNYETVKRFFSRLTIYLAEEHKLNAKNFLRRCNGHRIFSCDEGVFHLNLNEYSKKQGSLKKFSKFDAEGKNTRTVLMCMSASGNVLKPLIVNSGLNPTQYDSDTEEKYWTDCSDKGFLTAKVFYHWLINCFEPYLTQTHIERPVVLFLDGHFCHLNIPTLMFAKRKQIILYCLPTDASHLVQPIDSACFKPIEENYRKILREHANTAGIIPPKMFPLLLLKTMQKTRLQSQAPVGFEETGIVPLNSEAIDKSKLMTSNGSVESHVPDISLHDDKEKHVPSYEDSIVVIRAELNALQDFLLRIETILPRPYVAHFEEKHEAGEDVLDHSFFIWRDLKEKIRDIQTWLAQAQEENPHLFQNSDPLIHLISQDNQASFVQLQANANLQNQILSFPVSSSQQNPMINFPEGADQNNPLVSFHENATLQNVIETFPDNSLENFQENLNTQPATIEGFNENSTLANPIVTFTESAQHHIECFTENTANQNSLESESYSSYQNSVENLADNNECQNLEENESDSPKSSPIVGKRSSERGSPIKGKINLGSLYRNPVVSLVRTPVSNGKPTVETKKPKTTPKSKTSPNSKTTPKKLLSPQFKKSTLTPKKSSVKSPKGKKDDSKLKRKSSESLKSPKPKKIKKDENGEDQSSGNTNAVTKDESPTKSSEGSCIICKKKDGPNKVWIGCDCGNWCHKACVNVSLKLTNIQVKKLEFKCSICKKRKK